MLLELKTCMLSFHELQLAHWVFWHTCLLGISYLSLLRMSFKLNVVQANDKFLTQTLHSSLIFEIWNRNGLFDLIGTPTVLSMHSWSKIAELDFCFHHWYATVHVQWDAPWSVSSFVSFLKTLGTSFLESLSGQDFNRHITWLHVTVRSHTVIWTNNRYNVDLHYNCMVNLTGNMVNRTPLLPVLKLHVIVC